MKCLPAAPCRHRAGRRVAHPNEARAIRLLFDAPTEPEGVKRLLRLVVLGVVVRSLLLDELLEVTSPGAAGLHVGVTAKRRAPPSRGHGRARRCGGGAPVPGARRGSDEHPERSTTHLSLFSYVFYGTTRARRLKIRLLCRLDRVRVHYE